MKNRRNNGKTILYNIFIICMVLLALGTLLNLASPFSQVVRGVFIAAAFWVPLLELSVKLAPLAGIAALVAYLASFYVEGLSFLQGLMMLLAIAVTLLYVFALPSHRWFNSKVNEATAFALPPTRPQEKQGKMLSYLLYIISIALCFLNPFLLVQFFAHSAGNVLALIRVKGQLPRLQQASLHGTYNLPFEREWLVGNGGTDERTSHSWQVLNQRYAYDFVIADELGSRHKGTGEKLTDYYCYGEPVLAPADGQVVGVKDGIRNAPRPGDLWLDLLSRDFRGNHVIISHENGEYSFIGHFIPGSITVKLGDRVSRGEEIARCGNSGHSTEPHLHFHLQDSQFFYFAAGLPVRFSDVIANGEYKDCLSLEEGLKVKQSN